jgi:chemotaxis signal transduction protein
MSSSAPVEFLVVDVGGQCFALATAQVKTAVAALPVTPLPFVPAFVEGLVNINDRIVPQLDLGLLLAARATGAGGELVLVETSRSPCALHVAHILGKADIAADALQPLTDASGTLPVAARFEWEQQSVMVLDVDRLGSLISARDLPEGERGLLGRLQGEDVRQDDATLDCIVVLVGGERYALALGDLVEILDIPAATPVPGAPAAVEGLAIVREEVLLVLSLAALLQLPARADAAARSVVVVQREGHLYGLRVDAIDGLHQLAGEQLRRLDEGNGEVAGVLATDDALYALLTPARLIGEQRHRQFLPFIPQGRAAKEKVTERLHTVLQVALGDEAFGIPLGQIRRITDYCAPESVNAGAGALVTGAVNVEGRVVPVVDMATRLRAGTGNEGAWVIVGDGNAEWAIAVREAAGILDIPESALEPMGASRDGFVQAVASVDDRLISLLSLAPLMAAAPGVAAGGSHD